MHLTEFKPTDACEANFSFALLQELFETQTVASCARIFSWVESRSQRLTTPVIMEKSSLSILRCMNDLLRRVSKTGSTTPFCGRILTWISSVFKLSERSAVNLRGEYGRVWEGVQNQRPQPAEEKDSMDIDKTTAAPKDAKAGDKDGALACYNDNICNLKVLQPCTKRFGRFNYHSQNQLNLSNRAHSKNSRQPSSKSFQQSRKRRRRRD